MHRPETRPEALWLWWSVYVRRDDLFDQPPVRPDPSADPRELSRDVEDLLADVVESDFLE